MNEIKADLDLLIGKTTGTYTVAPADQHLQVIINPVAMGYTGDSCTSCGSFRMVRTGTCVTCQDCSANAGCG